MQAPNFQIDPISRSLSHSSVDFGACITGIDLENLDDEAFRFLQTALYQHQVLVLKGQRDISPKAQYELTKRFDPDADVYSHGKSIDKRSVLHKDLTTIPHQPQVQVIGSGKVENYEGLKDLQLVHPHHRAFHKSPVPENLDLTHTHFYRWHIDSAMYELDPPLVTSLLAIKVPQGRRQICRYDDGTGEELEVPLGTTAFCSGYRTYELLSDEDKALVRTSYIEYAAHPYVWLSKARSRSNGLGLYSEGLELAEDELPPINPAAIRRYPMTWRNPVTGKLALMMYPTPAKKIHLANGTVIEDLQEVRELLYRLQRPGISPEFVYAHDWQEGDLVLFNNHGVMHSIVGAFAPDEVRLFRQCNMAGSRPPLGPLVDVC